MRRSSQPTYIARDQVSYDDYVKAQQSAEDSRLERWHGQYLLRRSEAHVIWYVHDEHGIRHPEFTGGFTDLDYARAAVDRYEATLVAAADAKHPREVKKIEALK